jgi:hypothetical protein
LLLGFRLDNPVWRQHYSCHSPPSWTFTAAHHRCSSNRKCRVTNQIRRSAEKHSSWYSFCWIALHLKRKGREKSQNWRTKLKTYCSACVCSTANSFWLEWNQTETDVL